MKKLPVAGPTYDYKLENIRNDIIEQELALCLKKRENVYLDEDVQVKYTAADGTEYTFGQVTEDTVSLQTDVTTLQSDFTTLDGEVTANATAVSGLETRVTSAEGSISSNATAITSLQTDLTSAESDIAANSSAVTTLTSSVSTLDGNVSALSSSVTSLSTTVGSNTTNISTNASSINGIQGKYAVKINNNGHVSGFGLISTANNATPTSTFTVTADAFKIVDTSGSATPASPFEVYTSARVVDGVTVPAGVYMENANITAASIKTLDVDVINLDNVTLDTSGGNLIVKNAGIDTTQIKPAAVSGTEYNQGSSSNTIASTNTTETTLVQLTVTGASGSSVVTATVIMSHNNGSSIVGSQYRKFNLYLYEGSTVIGGLTNAYVGGYNTPSFTIKRERNFTGTKTYYLKVQNTGGTASNTLLFYPSITFVELKR